MLKLLAPPAHTVVLLLMLPGIFGRGMMLTANVCAPEVPQTLPAVTVILPPALPAVAAIAFVVEVPLHPFGRVQV